MVLLVNCPCTGTRRGGVSDHSKPTVGADRNHIALDYRLWQMRRPAQRRTGPNSAYSMQDRLLLVAGLLAPVSGLFRVDINWKAACPSFR